MRRIGVAVTLLAALFLAGCSAGERYPATTAHELQSGVRDAAAAAAAQDYAGGLAQLDQLQARIDAAAKRGDLTHERYLAVSRSLATVRTDLTQLQAAAAQARLQQQQELQQQQQQQQKNAPKPPKPKDDKGHAQHGG